jgi:pimeloyl-ACP methyl ester carboxylesterase
MTSGTFPSEAVIDINLQFLRDNPQLKPNWKVIDQVAQQFLDPGFRAAMEKALQRKIPIVSIVGSEDEETPLEARLGWEHTIAPTYGMWSRLLYPSYRRQHVVQGAGHQVFRRPPGLPADQFSTSDPDVIALRILLTFIQNQIEEELDLAHSRVSIRGRIEGT